MLLFFLEMMERIRRERHLHGLNSTTTSFVEQTELLAPFQTFRTAAMEEEQMELLVPFLTFRAATMEERWTELFIPFWTFRAAEIEEEQMELVVPFRTSHTAKVSIERNSSLRRWIEAHEYSLERS